MGGQQARGIILKTLVGKKTPAYLIRADNYFFRQGLYGDSLGDYADNAERFAFFCKATLDLAGKTAPWDIIHCHDWQASLIPVLKKTQAHLYPKIGTAKDLFTIHNLAHHGNFAPSLWGLLDLDMQYFTPRYLEFWGNINLLKGGVLFADAITTVSKRYASEIKTPEFGCGLEGVIRDREKDLSGILNGVDYQEWNPETDPYIKKNYSVKKLDGKKSCKKDLQETYGLSLDSAVPLLGMVSRLVDQKGLDLLVGVTDVLMQLGLQLVVLGSGEEKYQTLLADLATKYPEKMGVKIGFDNALAHKVEAGCDIFLMPSKFEPCGLSQMYSLKYGTIPLVRSTGGLDDTIEDYNPVTRTGNGFKFTGYFPSVFLEAVKRAIAVYCDRKSWRQLMAQAMAYDFSWEKSAKEYLALYRKLVESTTPG